MSFSARLGSSNHHRRKPFERPPRASARTSLAQEDAQPNETLGRRSSAGPPAVKASAAPRMFQTSSAGNSHTRRVGHPPGTSETLRSYHQTSQATHPRTKTSEVHGRATHSQTASTPRHQVNIRSLGSSAVGPRAGAAAATREGQTGYHGSSSASAGDPGKGVVRHTERPKPWTWEDRESIRTATLDSSGSVPSSSNLQQLASANRRYASVTQSTSAASSMYHASDGAISARTSSSSADILAGSSNRQASASDLLLTDLGTTFPSSRADCATQHLSPVATIEPAAVDTDTQRSSHPPPQAAQTSMSPAQSPLQAVKRERSPSPTLNAAPYLITDGCIRIAPLPLECRKTNTGFQAARQRLAASEMKKLRALGLQPTRVFTRDDGMVIDWYVSATLLSCTEYMVSEVH